MRTGEKIRAFYKAMFGACGPQGWWPADTPFEVAVGAILTQNTNWKNVERAIENLKREGLLSPAALAAVADERLAEVIRPAGYFRIKAKRLKNFIRHVHERHGGDLEAMLGLPDQTGADNATRTSSSKPPPAPSRSVSALREELLSINGIGRETADSIVLYAAGRPTFVVDAYTCRILLRHFLIAPEDDYEAIKELMESNLPTEVPLWNDYHAQLVAVGKTYCRPTARCAGCPLEGFAHDARAGQEP
jgi:endonuclease-3 related protein